MSGKNVGMLNYLIPLSQIAVSVDIPALLTRHRGQNPDSMDRVRGYLPRSWIRQLLLPCLCPWVATLGVGSMLSIRFPTSATR